MQLILIPGFFPQKYLQWLKQYWHLKGFFSLNDRDPENLQPEMWYK